MKNITKNQKIAACIIIVLIVLTVAFIWFNSCQTVEKSSESSGAVYSTVKKAVDVIFGKDKVPITHNIIRKLAHFSEFALLGAEFSVLLMVLKKENLVKYLQILPYGVFVASVDEGLQFISHRGPAVTDVLIDFCGYFAAASLFYVLFLIRRRIKAKKSASSSKN